MSPESLDHHSTLGELSPQLDSETEFMSGGFEDLEDFQKIIELGEEALPELLADMEDPSWWRMQAIWTIADEIGKAIELPEEIKGVYIEVRDQIMDWARAEGYLPEIPMSE